MTHVHDLIHTTIPYGTVIFASASITAPGYLSVWPQRDTRDVTRDGVVQTCVCVCCHTVWSRAYDNGSVNEMVCVCVSLKQL